MKLKVASCLLLFFCAAILFIGAKKSSFKPTPLQFEIPAGFPAPQSNLFAKNPLTEQGFQLGKKLFYDAALSKDGQVSCASCHQQFASFATYDHDFSHGVNNSFSTRNAPALINLAWMKNWHWDGGINHLEVQPLSPLTAANEMGETLASVLVKIKKDSTYAPFFKAAFGDATVSSERMLKAFAQFTASLVSANSKYDKVKRGEAAFIAPEAEGYKIFKANCNGCHTEPLFTNNEFRNNGIGQNKLNDVGRQNITMLASDSLKFKVPTLRNIALTLPYMHDGQMVSLNDVLTHYITLDTSKKNLDPLLQKKIVLTEKEKKQLTVFLYTLTDTSFTKNQRFAL